MNHSNQMDGSVSSLKSSHGTATKNDRVFTDKLGDIHHYMFTTFTTGHLSTVILTNSKWSKCVNDIPCDGFPVSSKFHVSGI